MTKKFSKYFITQQDYNNYLFEKCNHLTLRVNNEFLDLLNFYNFWEDPVTHKKIYTIKISMRQMANRLERVNTTEVAKSIKKLEEMGIIKRHHMYTKGKVWPIGFHNSYLYLGYQDGELRPPR